MTSNDVREVPLTRGLVALVDAEDFEFIVAATSWFAWPDGRTVYACGYMRDGNGSRRRTAMHTYLTGWPLVDHRNGQGLDNRRSNLRPATPAQNMWNRPANRNNTSGFKGVCRIAKTVNRPWRASIMANGQRRFLGYHVTPEEAARAYDRAALDLFGEFARTNFPREEYTS